MQLSKLELVLVTNRSFYFFFLSTTFLAYLDCRGQTTLSIANEEKVIMNSFLEYSIQSNPNHSIEKAREYVFNAVPSEGLRVDALGKEIWLRFTISNTTKESIHYFIDFIDYSHHEITLYDDGQPRHSGVSVAFEDKDVPGNKHAFSLKFEPEETRHFYLRIFSLNKQTISLTLLRHDVFLREVSSERANLGLFYGGLILVFLYSIILLLTTRFRLFAYFAAYVFFVGLLCGAGDGMTAEYLHWFVQWKGGFQDAASAAIANILGVLIMILFLNVKSWSTIFYKLAVGFMLSTGVLSFILLLIDSLYIFDFLGLVGIVQIGFLIVAGIRAIRNNIPQAEYYLVAQLIFGIFVVIFIMNLFRLLPYTFVTQYAIHLGYGANLLLLSTGLGVRMYSYYLRLLTEEQEKKALIKKRNESLEEEVEKRTNYLEEKESNLRSIIENNRSAIWLIDNQYRIKDFNSMFEASWKSAWGKELIIGESILEQLPVSEIKEDWKNRYDAAMAGEVGTYFDKFKIDNKWRHFEIKMFPILKSGGVQGVAIFSDDITNQLNSQKRLERQNELLKKVNQELDSFVYSASHDLKAPLASVLGLINLSRSEKSKSSINKYLDMMESSIVRLDGFIRDIIDYSRNARTKPKIIQIDLLSLINQVVEDLRYVHDKNKVKVNINFASKIPFFGDETRFKVIVRNLLSNALKYGCNKKSGNKIDIDLTVSKKELVLSIRDYGSGLKREYESKIFNMFFRASETKSGTGLGLYIVKETAIKLKGDVRLESDYGHGCNFIVNLPNHTMSDD